MEFTGSRVVPGTPQQVFRLLQDPEVLQPCIPGCEQIESSEGVPHIVAVAASVGPVKARFMGKLSFDDLKPPHSFRILGHGQGGMAGFGKLEASVMLSPHEAGTRVDYRAQASVGGKLAQVGSRLMDVAANKFTADFFDRFETLAQARQPVKPATVVESASPAKATPPSWVERFALQLNRLGALVTLAIAALIAFDMLSRNVLGRSLASVPELASISLVLIVFLQLPYAIASGKLLRVTILFDRMPAVVRGLLNVWAYGLAALLFFVLAGTSWQPLLESLDTQEFYGAAAFKVPAWPLRSSALLLWLVAGAGCTWLVLNAARGRMSQREEPAEE